MVPKPRGGHSGKGGANHSESRFRSTRRGGSPSLGRGGGGNRKGGCTPAILLGLLLVAGAGIGISHLVPLL